MQALKNIRNPGLMFVLPAVLIIALIMIFPLIYTIVLSFNKSDIYSDSWTFVGVSQYVELFKNPDFLLSLYVTFLWTIGSVVFQFLFGFAAAVVINQDFIKWKTLIRILLMVPWVIPSIISVNVWKWLYHADFGIINHILKSLGIITTSINWVSDEHTALFSAILVNVWKMYPLVMIMIEAALQSVPKELKDASNVDGATGWRQFRAVTIPHISSTCMSVILLLTIWTLNAFTFVFVLTEGGPAHQTEILSLFIYKAGFQNYNFGIAAAASTVLFIITAVLSFVYMKLLMKGEDG
ncbi:carbohydrate ABC transporter permease [Paenibacillus agricola]|uniref:Sugar ABC transporter permease n=1 Tax=Paenibacillus agricola TaxID=2716264 RepID=A0ABX0J7Y3_9BACL|nr:sugar ABC transporter permease [Paenibacillus agricola]NHN31495.1 sugar ABC transporter permease [Paenibacillus agricola]